MTYALHDKVVLITGATGGIGAACARALHAAGARLVLTDLSAPALAALAASLGGGEERVLSAVLDVTDRAAADAVVARTVRHFGGLDVVFANAGIAASPPATIAGIDERAFERVVEVDLLGVWRTVRAGLPEVMARRGQVLVTASIYAFVNGVANAPYAVSKAGVEMFGRALRAELAGSGATAGVLYPGWVDTPIAAVAFGGHAAATELVARAFPGPLGRAIAPERVAAAVVRGLERRAARIFVPRRWAPVSWLRGAASALVDRRFDRDRTLQALVGVIAHGAVPGNARGK